SYDNGVKDGIIVDAIKGAGAPSKLVDTTDLAMTKAINRFYKESMKKINTYLDKEEILSYKNDILKLKGLKRF
ncbi:MAG: hypothetical protein CSA19_01655, partial [Deltaproteobacteria bacterium]